MRVIGWIYMVFGALGVLVGLGRLGGSGLLLLVLAAPALVVGWGLLTLRFWAYWVAVGLALISVATGITWILFGAAISAVPLLVNAGILFYLWSPEGRTYGKAPRPRGER